MVAEGAEAGVVALGKARLAECPYQVLRSVLCEFQHGVLTLRGQLPTFFHKQLAQEAVGGLAGVERVVNQIEVASLANC
jgi:osmotically-inducible protein OsmY